jgi:hypothetical protein
VRNNPLKYTDPSGHYECEDEDNCNQFDLPLQENDDNDDDEDNIKASRLTTQEFEREWDWIPDGGRIEASGWIPALPIFGGDINVDFVSANLDPNETSIIIGLSPLVGIGQGGSGVGGLIWHDAKDLEEYKKISNNVAITAVPGIGAEVNRGISGSTGAKSLFVGGGSGAEFSGSYGKQLVTFDVFRGDLTLGGEVYNIQFDLWGENN